MSDASFERIIIPHSTVRLPWHNFDDVTYQFISTYRRHIPPVSHLSEGEAVIFELFKGRKARKPITSFL